MAKRVACIGIAQVRVRIQLQHPDWAENFGMRRSRRQRNGVLTTQCYHKLIIF